MCPVQRASFNASIRYFIVTLHYIYTVDAHIVLACPWTCDKDVLRVAQSWQRSRFDYAMANDDDAAGAGAYLEEDEDDDGFGCAFLR